jgi:hypothetical protein
MNADANTGAVIYIDRSDVHEGARNELEAGVRALVGFVDAHQPQMATYAVYFDKHASRMTVVSVHPSSASLERHIEIWRPEFEKLGHLLTLREIEVFGPLSERARELVHQKAAALGDGGVVTLHAQFAGFERITAHNDR